MNLGIFGLLSYNSISNPIISITEDIHTVILLMFSTCNNPLIHLKKYLIYTTYFVILYTYWQNLLWFVFLMLKNRNFQFLLNPPKVNFMVCLVWIKTSREPCMQKLHHNIIGHKCNRTRHLLDRWKCVRPCDLEFVCLCQI